MAQKCVHKGCGKAFSDPDEPCIYHPGPPIFHEGQKGWTCCKPRVLTFDEFLSIPPCTTGKHSTTDEAAPPVQTGPAANAANLPPAPAPKPIASSSSPADPTTTLHAPQPRLPQHLSSAAATPTATPPPPEPETDSDAPAVPVPAGKTCRRRGCGVAASAEAAAGKREGEECNYHPGRPIFHEGSKGWTCCKRRVLEFDEFLKIGGCEVKDRHLFVGSGKEKEKKGGKVLETIRHDYYQTPSTVHASLFLKKIDKQAAKIEFSSSSEIDVDLPTADGTRYTATIPLFGLIDPEKSSYKIMGTKVDLTLVKEGGGGFNWPVLRADDQRTGEIIQSGRAGVA